MSNHAEDGLDGMQALLARIQLFAVAYDHLFRGRQIVLQTRHESVAVFWQDHNFMHLCGLGYNKSRADRADPRYRGWGGAAIFYDKLINGRLDAAQVRYTHNRGIALDKLSVMGSMLETPDNLGVLVDSPMKGCEYAFGTGEWCVGVGHGHGRAGDVEPFDPDVPAVLVPVTLRKGPTTGGAAMRRGTTPRKVEGSRVIPPRI